MIGRQRFERAAACRAPERKGGVRRGPPRADGGEGGARAAGPEPRADPGERGRLRGAGLRRPGVARPVAGPADGAARVRCFPRVESLQSQRSNFEGSVLERKNTRLVYIVVHRS